MSKLLGKYQEKSTRTDRVRDVDISFAPLYTQTDYIKSKIKTVVLTREGELLLDPEFGTRVFDLLYNNPTRETLGDIKNNIKFNINKYIEEINQVKVDIDLVDDNTILIKIYYNINDTEDYLEINYAFNI